MNNYCRNCGAKLTNFNICEKCGTKVLKNRIGELDDVLEKKYIRIFFLLLILYFISYSFYAFSDIYILNVLAGIIFCFLPLVFIIFIIFAKKKLRYSKFFNILFGIISILIILIIFLILSWNYVF